MESTCYKFPSASGRRLEASSAVPFASIRNLLKDSVAVRLSKFTLHDDLLS